MIGLVLLGGNWIKDKWFEKKKGKGLQDQVKFENAHLKRIEIIEKIIIGIYKLNWDCSKYFMSGVDNSQKFAKIITTADEIFCLEGLIKLYFNNEFCEAFDKFTFVYINLITHYYIKCSNSKLESIDLEEIYNQYKSDIEINKVKITDLSKDILLRKNHRL